MGPSLRFACSAPGSSLMMLPLVIVLLVHSTVAHEKRLDGTVTESQAALLNDMDNTYPSNLPNQPTEHSLGNQLTTGEPAQKSTDSSTTNATSTTKTTAMTTASPSTTTTTTTETAEEDFGEDPWDEEIEDFQSSDFEDGPPEESLFQRLKNVGTPFYFLCTLLAILFLFGLEYIGEEIYYRGTNLTPSALASQPLFSTKSSTEVKSIPIEEEEDHSEKRALEALRKLMRTPYEEWAAMWTKKAAKIEPSEDECRLGREKEFKKKWRPDQKKMCVDSTCVVTTKHFVDANWMDEDETLICASAPIGAGVPGCEDTRADFYHMLASHGVTKIAMLCQMGELAPAKDKKEYEEKLYYPYEKFGGQTYKKEEGKAFHVTCMTSKRQQVGLEKSTLEFSVTNPEGKVVKQQKITHYHMNTWSVNGLCTDTEAIGDLLIHLLDDGHIGLIHCMDGQGRSGSFVFALMLIREVLLGKKYDPIGLAVQIQKNRYKAMINAPDFMFGLYVALATLSRYVLDVPDDVFENLTKFSVSLVIHQAEVMRAEQRKKNRDADSNGKGKKKKGVFSPTFSAKSQ